MKNEKANTQKWQTRIIYMVKLSFRIERKKNKNWRRNNEFYRHVKAKKKIINIKSALQGTLKGHL